MQTVYRSNGSLGAIGLGLLSFALLTWQVQLHGPLTALDLRFANWLHAHVGPWLTQVFIVLTDAHNTFGLLTIGAAICTLLLVERRWQALAFASVSIGGGMLLNVALKLLFQRARPVFAEPLLLLESYSFPSGHALGSTVLYGTIAVLLSADARWRRPAFFAALSMVFLVALSRVYLGAHYLSDVTAGIALGVVWVNFWRLLLSPAANVRTAPSEVR